MNSIIATRRNLPTGMDNVPFNQWYVVAGRAEIGPTPMARRMLDQPLVLFRTTEGRAVALPDRCPHRLAPFSKGQVIGDEIQCPYHGFRFGADGKCKYISTQDSIPDAMRVRSFPLVERGYWTWIWMGDEDKADPALIPVTDFIKPHYKTGFHFCYPCTGNYMRLHENLLDTSHPSFLHAGAFDDGDLADATFEVESKGKVIRLTRRSRQPIFPGPSTRALFNIEPGKPVIRTLITETHVPNFVIIANSFKYVDEPNRPPEEFINEFPVSPASPKSCYQFWSSAASFPIDYSEKLFGYFRSIMAGDDMALEAIERRLEEDPDAVEVSVKADEAAIRFRRILMQMVADERSATQEAAQ